MHVLKKKCVAALNERLKFKNSEDAKIVQRYQNIKSDITSQQGIECNKLESTYIKYTPKTAQERAQNTHRMTSTRPEITEKAQNQWGFLGRLSNLNSSFNSINMMGKSAKQPSTANTSPAKSSGKPSKSMPPQMGTAVQAMNKRPTTAKSKPKMQAVIK